MSLPPDWKLGQEGEEWYWPIRWLKILARLPIHEAGAPSTTMRSVAIHPWGPSPS